MRFFEVVHEREPFLPLPPHRLTHLQLKELLAPRPTSRGRTEEPTLKARG